MPLETRTIVLLALCAAVLVGACDDVDSKIQPGPSELVTERALVGNDLLLNSASLNGWSLNGFRTNGWSLNGWSLNGWSLNGWSLNNVSLSGSAFTGVASIDGEQVVLVGEDLIGTELALSHEGVPFTLRFDDIYINPADPDGDVYFYKVTVHDPDTDTWTSLCRDSYGEPIEAIALKHHWNPNTGARVDDPVAVTLACRGAALAKCVEWGYRPWATVESCDDGVCTQVNLTDHHQACTRMARADYCGDGVPHTLNNTPIDIYDRLKPKIQTQSSSGKDWKVEAEWGPDGAQCLGKQLRVDMFAALNIAHTAPPCRAALTAVKNCGQFLGNRPNSKLGNHYCAYWNTDPAKCALP
ncbi:MAG TPA: ADYC domain-containing protein [Nannocystis sp.]